MVFEDNIQLGLRLSYIVNGGIGNLNILFYVKLLVTLLDVFIIV